MPKPASKAPRPNRGPRAPRLSRGPSVPFRSVHQGPIAFPDRQRTRLTYVDNGRITSASSFAGQTWRLNSVFDPDETGVGHQPRFYDTYAAIYARYIVTGVEARISARQRAAHGLSAVLLPANGAVTLTTANYPAEARRASQVRSTGSAQPVIEFNTKFDPSTIAGVTSAIYRADDRFQAGVGSNPTEVVNLNLFLYNMDGTTALDAEYSITLIYDVEFFDLALPGPSLDVEDNHQTWETVSNASVSHAAAPPRPLPPQGADQSARLRRLLLGIHDQ